MQGSARYVRMLGTARGTTLGYSLLEFEVYGKVSASSCAEPTDLGVTNIYENEATLNWNANGADSFHVQYKTVSAGSWTTVSSPVNSLTLTGLSCASDYLFQVQGKCSANSTSIYSAPASFSTLICNANCSPLPTRWSTQDIGDAGVAGSACFSNNVFTLKGSGDDIWNTADAFRFAYTTNLGDLDIKARVLTMDQTNEWNKCGIMIRESLTPGSKHAFISITGNNGAAFQNRIVADDQSYNENTGPGIQPPYWIRLEKKGAVYTAYSSPDDVTWTQVGNTVNADFGNNNVPVYAGLALTSHDNNVLSTATIDNYQLTGTSLPLELVRFNAALSLRQTINLQWVTASEKDMKEFVIEKSTDNLRFNDLATVKAVNSGGNAKTYNYEDKLPVQGLNYYRLRMTGFDGSVNYSAVAFARLSGTKAPLLSPNPASNIVNITQGSEAIKFVNVYDISGKIIRRITNTAGTNVITIPVNNLANSTYIIEMLTATGVYREKLLIRN